MGKKKRRRRKPTAQPSRKVDFLADILAGTISGLITAAILKLLDWSRPGLRRPEPPHPKYKRNAVLCQ